MELEITVYKGSGKWYASHVVRNEEDIHNFKEEFLKFVFQNLPARVTDGYVVVKDVGVDQSFHNSLYLYNELYEQVHTHPDIQSGAAV